MTRGKGEEAAGGDMAAVREGCHRRGEDLSKVLLTGAKNPSQASRDLIKNFLSKTNTKREREDWAASIWPNQVA